MLKTWRVQERVWNSTRTEESLALHAGLRVAPSSKKYELLSTSALALAQDALQDRFWIDSFSFDEFLLAHNVPLIPRSPDLWPSEPLLNFDVKKDAI
jgi:hypothetical protein